MPYKYSVGDRVVSLIDDSALFVGETGVVVKTQGRRPPVIEWDEFNPERHDSDGLVPNGHGWYIFDNNHITLDMSPKEDLGEFTPNLAPDSIASLFGG